MDDNKLLDEILAQNPWWRTGKITLPEKTIERTVYPELKKELNEKEVLGLVGLRSVGKTTLMKQLMHGLLGSVDPKEIFYFSFDDIAKEDDIMERIIELYLRHILKQTMTEVPKCYIFFDEVQKIAMWGEKIKKYHDKGLKFKFTVSGSSSMNILRGSGESLVGRIIIHKLYPFTFREFLEYNQVKAVKQNMWKPEYPLAKDKFELLFERYLEEGGFPVLYGSDPERRRLLLKNMLDLTFYRDIVNVFEIKKSDLLEGLFYTFVRESGDTMNYSNLSNSLKTKFETVKQYIDYLDVSFLISKSRFYSKSKIKSLEKNEKIYVADHAFDLLQEMKGGNKIETVVFNGLKILNKGEMYWRNERKNEVDIILIDKEIIPIEVKYQSKILDSDLEGLNKFMTEYGLNKGILVTKNLLERKTEKGREILCVPVWLFLLAV